LLGPDVPAPRAPSDTLAFREARLAVETAIIEAIETARTRYGPIDASATSFSVDIFSMHDGPLFTFHYDALGLSSSTEGVRKIDSNSIYRLGSISKLLTVYTFLAAVGDGAFHQPIIKYIPELEIPKPEDDDLIDYMDWNEITIGALASQLGGLPRETAGSAGSDALIKDSLPPMSLPAVTTVPKNLSDDQCPNPLSVPCTKAAFLQNINYQHPALAPFWGPSYSNVAYGLLALALENMTASSFPDLITSKLIRPLELNNTYYTNAPLSRGVIPYNDTAAGYSADGLFVNPAGSFYSSINDMRQVGIAMLNSTLLSPAQTRRWMKPQTFTANDNFAVGAPWEIFKGTLPGKSTWMFTKGGDLGKYSTKFALLPDYDAGFTVLTAGDDANNIATIMSNIIAEIVIPALQRAAREEARHVYAGIYQDITTNDTLVIGLDNNPGLLITEWKSNGADVVEGFREGGYVLRLNPSGLQSKDGRKHGFRMIRHKAHLAEGLFALNCVDWLDVSGIVYGGVALDEFVITLGNNKKRALVVDAKGFRSTYLRL
jgi:CubicO group peptidase (beta-lactamase class C family)